jgi:hypothetical protein
VVEEVDRLVPEDIPDSQSEKYTAYIEYFILVLPLFPDTS